MDVLDFAPSVSPDGSKIAFRSSERTGFAECVISREALEAHFWLPPGADEVRTLKTFADGRERNIAVAERKIRARPDQPVRIAIADFLGTRVVTARRRRLRRKLPISPAWAPGMAKDWHYSKKSTTVQMLINYVMSN
jgi:hypothetical protein